MAGTVAIVSFRLGGPDGVSVVAGHWSTLLMQMGFSVKTVAGEGDADVLVPGLTLEPAAAPKPANVEAALGDADLVVVENLCTIPLNLPASRIVAATLRGRPAILHHHDPPWQRARFAHVTELPPDDDDWVHVVINRITQRQFTERGLASTLVYNGFDTNEPLGDRHGARAQLEIEATDVLALHPVRAIERKNIAVALSVCADLDAIYWLPGPAEDGYGPELDELLAATTVEVRRHPMGSRADAYAASDVVLFPSTWEGFGNPPLEAAIHRRPVVVGDYPVAEELRAFGFRWLDAGQPDLASALASPDRADIETNLSIVRRHFSLERLGKDIERLLATRSWLQ